VIAARSDIDISNHLWFKDAIFYELEHFKSDYTWPKAFSSYGDGNHFEKSILTKFLKKSRWFGGKAKPLKHTTISRIFQLEVAKEYFYIAIIEAAYAQGLSEYYSLPLAFVEDVDDGYIKTASKSLICKASFDDRDGFIVDALSLKSFRDYFFTGMKNKLTVKLTNGSIIFLGSNLKKITHENDEITSEILQVEQSNTSIIYNSKYFFKIYRKIESEINPELEITQFLSERTSFRNASAFVGGVEIIGHREGSFTFGSMQEMVANQGDTWNVMLDSIGSYYDGVLSKDRAMDEPPELNETLDLSFEDLPEIHQHLIGRVTYERVKLLAQRTAQMHNALGSDPNNPDFAPEPFTLDYQRSLYSSYKNLVRDRFDLLEKNLDNLPEDSRNLGKNILDQQDKVLEFFQIIYKNKIEATKIRIHGDYHLGQVLCKGDDFVIIDFEGEPGVSFSERRLKRSPLKDVAGMLRSFHYASYGKIILSNTYSDKEIRFLEPWAEQWQHYVLRFFLRSYLEFTTGMSEITPTDKTLLQVYMLEKAVYEMGYELNSRLDWVKIPLLGIAYLLKRFADNSSNGEEK